MSKKDDRRTSILKPNDEQDIAAASNPIKRRVSFHTHRTVKEYEKGEHGVGNGTPKNESIHFSGSSEERSSFFGGNRPGSALTFTSHQTTDIKIADHGHSVTMNATANATIAMFDRVQRQSSVSGDEADTTLLADPTLALLDHLIPSALVTPPRTARSIRDEHTLAFMEEFNPAVLTPEVRASPKRLNELYYDLCAPVKGCSPTSDSNPHSIDPNVSKAFESCTLSPVKHLQCHEPKAMSPLRFDLNDVDEEMPLGSPEPEKTSSKEVYNPMENTYVVSTQMRDTGYYIADDSEMETETAAVKHDDKTYVVKPPEPNNDEDDTVESSTAPSEVFSPKPSAKNIKNMRRISDILDREKRRTSILVTISSASNSPAITEDTRQNTSSSSQIMDKTTKPDFLVYEEKMDASLPPKEGHSSGTHSLIDTFQRMPGRGTPDGTQLLEDVQTPSRYLDDSNLTMPAPENEKPNEVEATVTMDKTAEIFSMLQTPKRNQTCENVQSSPNFSFNASSVGNKSFESPKINKTPGWNKYSKCLEIMKEMSEKEKLAITMENFEEEPDYLNGDSVIMDPTTPRKKFSVSYREEYRQVNLEEPPYPDSFLDDKENNSSGVMNSTYCKASAEMQNRVYRLSRFGNVERSFAPDQAFFIEKIIKEVNEIVVALKALKIDLPGFENVVPEFLVYDEQLVLAYYYLLVKISVLDLQSSTLNGNKAAGDKLENLKFIQEKIEALGKTIKHATEELTQIGFSFTKFSEKKIDYIVRVSANHPEVVENCKNQISDWKLKVDQLKAVYFQREKEVLQELNSLKEKCLKVEKEMTQKCNAIFAELANGLQSNISKKL